MRQPPRAGCSSPSARELPATRPRGSPARNPLEVAGDFKWSPLPGMWMEPETDQAGLLALPSVPEEQLPTTTTTTPPRSQ